MPSTIDMPADIAAREVLPAPVDVAAPALPLITESEREYSRFADFFELTKPRMNFLVVLTTLVGFYLAKGASGWVLMFHTIFGTALTAAAASVFNQVIERCHDALMPRTRNRPVAAGRISVRDAAVFGVLLAIGGLVDLALAVNLLTASLAAVTMLLYLLVYTPMKRVTTLNTVIGAIPGAIPPMMGFSAVENALPPAAWMLFGVLFLWQMPHFLAIATMYRDDYAKGGFKMLPSVDPTLERTCLMVILYTLALIPVSLLAVAPLRVSGLAYLFAAVVLGGGFLWFGVQFVRQRTRPSARRLFFASVIYLPLLLAAMMIDRVS
jgi:heme o synthase